jgi:hypothetical protein
MTPSYRYVDELNHDLGRAHPERPDFSVNIAGAGGFSTRNSTLRVGEQSLGMTGIAVCGWYVTTENLQTGRP